MDVDLNLLKKGDGVRPGVNSSFSLIYKGIVREK